MYQDSIYITNQLNLNYFLAFFHLKFRYYNYKSLNSLINFIVFNYKLIL